jgi:hypothetical protein
MGGSCELFAINLRVFFPAGDRFWASIEQAKFLGACNFSSEVAVLLDGCNRNFINTDSPPVEVPSSYSGIRKDALTRGSGSGGGWWTKGRQRAPVPGMAWQREGGIGGAWRIEGGYAQGEAAACPGKAGWHPTRAVGRRTVPLPEVRDEWASLSRSLSPVLSELLATDQLHRVLVPV